MTFAVYSYMRVKLQREGIDTAHPLCVFFLFIPTLTPCLGFIHMTSFFTNVKAVGFRSGTAEEPFSSLFISKRVQGHAMKIDPAPSERGGHGLLLLKTIMLSTQALKRHLGLMYSAGK